MIQYSIRQRREIGDVPPGRTHESEVYARAQHAYPINEKEMLAIPQVLPKWEDKLLGRKVHVITDHQALKFPKKIVTR